MKKLIDYHTYIQDSTSCEMLLESFQGDGISLTIHIFGMAKSITIDVYDELLESYTRQFNNFLTILDQKIVEKIECELKKCFENELREI